MAVVGHDGVVPQPTEAHRIAILAFDGVQSLDVTGPAEVFAGANQFLAKQGAPQGYDVAVVSLNGGVIGTESAVRLDTDSVASLGRKRIDTLIIPGGLSVLELRDDDDFVAVARKLINRCNRLITVCTGTYIAAAAGALAGHTVTTHWARADRLAESHADVTVDADPIFIHSRGDARDVWSSAGVTAGIDLSLAVVEADHSTEVAQTVARWLVMYLRRPGGQSQFAAATWIRQAAPGPIHQAQDLVINNPGADLRVAALAQQVAMSERHFVRRFTDEVGLPPAKYVARVRVDAARHELERSPDTVAAIAKRCGFGCSETLRRTLQRHLGVSPEGYRQRFSHNRPPAHSSAP
jgi:transcriptional regulator GlxA family with amidase domain